MLLQGRPGYGDYNKAVFDAHNVARTNPKLYANLIQTQMQNFIYTSNGVPTNSICVNPDFVPKSSKCSNSLMTIEGTKGWSDTISYLNNFNVKLNKLKWSESLSQSCYDLISDQGPKGGTGHIGSNGSTPFKRIEKYTKNSGSGENLTFLDVIYPEDPIVKLLIDDGVQGKGHRENILNKDFTHLGVSCGCHKLYGEMCCFDYGINVIENNPKLNANTAPQLKSCTNYQINTKDDLTTNYILTSTNGSQAGSSFNTNINGNKISISTEIKNMSSGIITKSYKINVVRSTGATSNYSYSWTGTESLAPSNEAVLGYFGLK